MRFQRVRNTRSTAISIVLHTLLMIDNAFDYCSFGYVLDPNRPEAMNLLSATNNWTSKNTILILSLINEHCIKVFTYFSTDSLCI